MPGSIHGLVGENGAGKSTLINIISGLLAADSGTLELNGQVYNVPSRREALQKGIALAAQELSLIDTLTVAENIFLGREPRNTFGLVGQARLRSEARNLLEQLGIKIDLDIEVGDLSVAYQQMIEIAKALSKNADLIVMDEPSAILAGTELEQLFNIIQSLVKRGVSVIYISHRLEEVFKIAIEANNNIRTLGVAVSPCILPEAGKPTFEISDDEIEIGREKHGNPE